MSRGRTAKGEEPLSFFLYVCIFFLVGSPFAHSTALLPFLDSAGVRNDVGQWAKKRKRYS